MKKLLLVFLFLLFLLFNTKIKVFASDYPHYASGSANLLPYICLVNDGTYQNTTITFDQSLNSGYNPRWNDKLTYYYPDAISDTLPIDFSNDGSTVWATPNSFIAPIEVGGLNNSQFINTGYYTMWFNWNNTLQMDGFAAPFQVVTDLSQCSNPIPTYTQNDKSSNGNNLTNSGTTDWTTDTPIASSSHAIKAVAASQQFLYAPDSPSLSVTGSLTVEEWVKFDSLPSTGEVFFANKYRDDNNQISWTFALQNNGGVYRLRSLTSTNGSNYEAVTSNWTPSTGVWYHVAMVYDANVPSVKFYVNGVQQGATQSKSYSSIYDSTAALQIGVINYGGSPSQYLDGKVDELRIWNVARTQTEINNNKNIELTGSESGLVAYYPFEVL